MISKNSNLKLTRRFSEWGLAETFRRGKRTRLIFSVGFILATLAGLLVLRTARAASAPPDGPCVFEPQLIELQNIQTNLNLNYREEITAELSARKKILLNVVSCARREAESTKARLNEVDITANNSGVLKDRLLGQMDEALQSYDLFSAKINDLGLLGTKQFADDLRTWRATAYATTLARVTNFILWTKNQELFHAAQTRFDQMSQTLRTLGVAESEDIAKLLNQTATDFRAATLENESARQTLMALADPKEALALIQTSLTNLAATYANFADLSQAAQKILPH